MLTIQPINLREACAFVKEHHRHHKAPRGCLFCVAVNDGERVRGVAIVGRPVSRMLQDNYTAEVTRVATDGAWNACSMLYGAAWRACRALGYRRLVTYTLPEEGGGQPARRGIHNDRRGGWRFVESQGAPTCGPAPDTAEATMGEKKLTTAPRREPGGWGCAW